MPDNLSPEDRHKTMRAVRGKNTSLERRLFAMLAGMRLSGWKKDARTVVGNPDAVFPKERVAIFVDGCFWHGCPHCKRKMPKTNSGYWKRKIGRNIERDQHNRNELTSEGWVVTSIWEHEMGDPALRAKVRMRLFQAVKGETPSEKSARQD
jgi:DNA mismatch endonuclease Vsr